MANQAVLKPVERPDTYQAPNFADVSALLATVKKQRQPVIDRIWELKRARRGQWDDVIRHIPSAYRKMLLPPDLPQLRDMINRVAGLIAKQEPNVEVMPPSGKPSDVQKASKEEARLHAMRVQIADQQDRDPYAMGIDAQVSWGESWIGVYPDPRRLDDPDYKRGKDEEADDYKGRYKQLMADGGIPICIDDFDPQTVFPFMSQSKLAVCMVESEHLGLDIEVGLGYHPVKGADGKTAEWLKHGHTLSEPYVASDSRAGSDGRAIDTTHDRGTSVGATALDRAIRKIVYMDPWVYQCYLDGVLVEEWEHNFGIVPMFPAYGEQTSDRDPGWQSHGIVDPALAIAKQVVMFSAIIASNAMQHGFPTPFLKNPQHGLVDPRTNEPLSRAVRMGEINVLGQQEEITFPFLEGAQMPAFFQHMDYLNGVLEGSTLSNFGKAIGSDIAGYAIAQIRSMQLSVLSPIYKNATRQWRKIMYFLRHIVKTTFPAGLFLRGAVEVTEDGDQFRPIMEYAKGDCTDFSINVHIDEGIQQDEIAERKSALEMQQAGVWSIRRVMEKSGVEDPAAEKEEIDTDRMMGSQAFDGMVLQMATEIVTERMAATRQQKSTPFGQAIDDAKASYMGGGGQFQNQGASPMNADQGGTPLNQQAQVPTPLEGGPTAGPPEGISMKGLGIPQLPGGVKDVQQIPVGAPG